MSFKINCSLTFLLLFALLSAPILSNAQEKQIQRLNEHFYPITDNDSLNYAYKAVVVKLTDSTSIERIFNLNNQIVKVTRYGYNGEGNFPEENIETYDTNGKLSSKKIKNRNNGYYHATYYNGGETMGEVLYQGSNNYEIREAESGEIIHMEQNPFEPQPLYDEKGWEKTMVKNLSYPVSARRRREQGTVIIGIYVNEFGERTAPLVVNPDKVSESLAEEALRVVNKYEGEITPATTVEGNTIDAWLYIPIRFMLD
ncbi:TonB family protein [Algoriphagus sp. NG3]|uniref:TonB family protein n=1 Tax=Algoriphagus sp. NG3 TaxID=3097546 RepID=UPI002A7FF7D6|nr:TonB family protein [Algoriphagus sp. NG3]WPR76104.1 TonB family protein [Algoriphagus sp. NG3]